MMTTHFFGVFDMRIRLQRVMQEEGAKTMRFVLLAFACLYSFLAILAASGLLHKTLPGQPWQSVGAIVSSGWSVSLFAMWVLTFLPPLATPSVMQRGGQRKIGWIFLLCLIPFSLAFIIAFQEYKRSQA